MKRSALYLALFLFLLGAVPQQFPVSAKDNWIRVSSKNFVLVGNAGEKDLRQVAVRLEQFREAFSRMFTKASFTSPVPTTVIVFKNDSSYRPFKLNANSAGYFQPGTDVNYITLTTEVRGEQNPFTVIFHEYTHLLVNNTTASAPTWFNEGLAEVYSTFSMTQDQKIALGKPISGHVYLLRENRMLPLRTLFQVDHNSPYYNERDKQSIFYAECWALMHYLVLGKNGERLPLISKFLKLTAAEVPLEQAFQQSFGMSFESMENELREYIRRDQYPVLNVKFNDRISLESEMPSAPISEAEAQAYLGDLLLHTNRADSEVYLQKALALDPNLAMANASLGMLKVRQGKTDEARQSLERAVAADSKNYLTHYYYAYALSREGNGDMQIVTSFAPENTARMRNELKQAIELRPDYLESYSLLAFVNLVTGTELDETVGFLKKALATSPGRNDLVFMLAQVYLRKEDYKSARQLLEHVSSHPDGEETVRRQAQRLLGQVTSMEQQMARIQAERDSRQRQRGGRPALTEEGEPGKIDPSYYLRESLRPAAEGETQLQALLIRVDCDAKGIFFVLKMGDRLLRLKTDNFERVEMTTFSEDAGREMTCGPRKTENNVIVSYVASAEGRGRVDGVIKAIEFVPKDFQLKP